MGNIFDCFLDPGVYIYSTTFKKNQRESDETNR